MFTHWNAQAFEKVPDSSVFATFKRRASIESSVVSPSAPQPFVLLNLPFFSRLAPAAALTTMAPPRTAAPRVATIPAVFIWSVPFSALASEGGVRLRSGLHTRDGVRGSTHRGY